MSENTISQQQTLFVADSPANLTASQAIEKPLQMIETYGASSPVLFASVNQNGYWLRMSQGYYLAKLDGSLVEFSGTWPQAGTILNGKAYRLRRLVRRISARGSSLLPTMRASEKGNYQYSHGDHSKKVLTLTGYVALYPTPTTTDTHQRFNTSVGSNNRRPNLSAMAKYNLFPTPCATNWKNRETSPHSRDLQKAIGGQLNPQWVEWLMGFPSGWTDLEDSGTL